MSDEIREAMSVGWNVFSAVCGAVLTLVVHAYRFGGKMSTFVTHSELDKKLEPFARKDQLDDLKDTVESIRDEQNENFRTVITLLGGKK